MGIFISLLLVSASYADTATSVLQTTATLNSTCAFYSDNVNFGEWTPDVDKFVSFEIDVKCNKGTLYTIRGTPRSKTNYGNSHQLQGSIAGNNQTLRYDIHKNLNGTWYYYSDSDASKIDGVGTGNNYKHLMRAVLAGSVDAQSSRVTPDNYIGNYTLYLTY